MAFSFALSRLSLLTLTDMKKLFFINCLFILPTLTRIYGQCLPEQSIITGPTTKVCIGATFKYSISNLDPVYGNNYSWSLLSGGEMSLEFPPPPGYPTPNIDRMVKWTSAGTHIIQVTLTNSCNQSIVTQFPVTVLNEAAPPDPDITGVATACSNTTTSYSVTPISGYDVIWWTPPSGGNVLTPNNNSATVTWNMSDMSAGVYANYSGANCNSTQKYILVTVPPSPPPTPIITGSTNVCANGIGVTYSSTAVDNDLLNWSLSGGGTIMPVGNPVTASWTTAGNFDVQCYRQNMCDNSAVAHFPVTVKPLPVVTASDKTICSGANTSLPLTSSVSGTTFSWTIQSSTGVSGATAGSGSSINQTLSTTGTAAGQVVYRVTPVASGCTGNFLNVTVTVNPVPAITNSPGQFQNTICSGSTLNFTPTSNITSSTFSWTSVVNGTVSGASASGSGPITNTLINTGTTDGTVTYSIRPVSNGCTGNVVNYVVTIKPNVLVTTPNKTICSGNNTGISLTSPLSGATFTWTIQSVSGVSGAAAGSGNTINQTLTTTSAAVGTVIYRVIPIANGCSGNPHDITVTVKPLSTITVTPSAMTMCSDSTVTLTASGASNYSWSPATGLSATTGASVTAHPSVTTTYTITGSDANSCSGTQTVTVTIRAAGNCYDALSFDGNDNVGIPEQNGRLNLGTGDFVMEAYIKSNSASGIKPLLSKRTLAGGGFDGFYFGVWSDGRPFLQLDGTPNILPPVGSANLHNGTCHHVAVRRNGITISFFVDGVFIGNGDNFSSRDISSTGTLFMGNDLVLPTGFNGWMGEVRVWNTALTNTQIQNNKSINLTPQTGLMGYYDMKGGGAMQSLDDISTTALANKNNGTLGGTTGVDTSDPAWLTVSQLTCTVSGNFRQGTPNEYTVPDSTGATVVDGLKVYPNPVNGELHIDLSGSSEELVSAALFDGLGKMVAQELFNTGRREILIYTKELAQGVYVLHIFSNEGLLAREKVIIVH